MKYILHLGDCLESMRNMADNSVDSIVTDPPYEIGFMGKGWDSTGIANSAELWREALRVLKPGGHLLSFSGARTYHRMTCAIEDAGFEIRDQIMWVYGSGFPKSLNIGKALDKLAGANREVVGKRAHPTLADKSKVDRQGKLPNHGTNKFSDEWDLTATSTDAAKQWEGWGTALKPAHEPICVARKPFYGTVAANVIRHGTGAINVDGCRVAATDFDPKERLGASKMMADRPWQKDQEIAGRPVTTEGNAMGRWPANLIHDGSDSVLAGFPESKVSGSAKNGTHSEAKPKGIFGERTQGALHNDAGSAARFFYCAKTSRKDRHEGMQSPGAQFSHGATLRKVENTETVGNNHPTVKPTDLMRYLCRLVTPPGGTVLDPFMGSGSTGKAAMLEGFKFVGCEMSEEYMGIAKARIAAATELPEQPELFAA